MVAGGFVQGDVWEVVGGGDKGGIIVRIGKDLASSACPARLACGAQVRVMEFDSVAGRMSYELVQGSGPASGWVSFAVRGKQLLAKSMTRCSPPVPKQEEPHLHGSRQQLARCRSAYVRSGRPRCAAATVRGVLATPQVKRADYAGPGHVNYSIQDNDRETVFLCPACELPLGDVGYAEACNEYGHAARGRRLVHAECKAQIIREGVEKQARLWRDEQDAVKRALGEKYGIGWMPSHIPSNAALAGKLSSSPAPARMSGLSLTYNQDLRVVATSDPAACVHLEYLSIALRARVREGREPFFSLDPRDSSPMVAWQVKRFEPQWLASTSAGEVMFQADYFLKALSMGEHSQPIIGMKSCLDHLEEGPSQNWNAREWFVVKKASVGLSHDQLLIPHVAMGVEAREQVQGPAGLEDARITELGHPLVKYAERFSHFFDLIAERWSVMYHLRALAKSTVLAKFLVDANVRLEDTWLNLAREKQVSTPSEVPQLWNLRCSSKVEVREGRILNAEDGTVATHGLYGGVQFRLDQLHMAVPSRFAAAVAAPSRPPVSTAPAAAAPIVPVPAPAVVFQAQSTQLVSKLPTGPVLRPFGLVASNQRIALSTSTARGVDLNLDTCNLSEVVPESSCPLPTGGEMRQHSPPPQRPSGRRFWDALSDETQAMWPEKESALWRHVFSAGWHDRSAEGDEFVPPDPSPLHQQKLRTLVNEELAMSSQLEARDTVHAEILHCEQDLQRESSSLDKAREADAWVVKVTQYVERAAVCADVQGHRVRHHYYAVLELDIGDSIVTEWKAYHGISWKRNPSRLQARNAVARVLRSTDCSSSCLRVADFTSGEVGDHEYEPGCLASISEDKHHTMRVYSRALLHGEPALQEDARVSKA